MSAMATVLPPNSVSHSFSQDFNAATHSSSIDIFDSLGTKHTVSMSYRKVSANRWDETITVPDYATISPTNPQNERRGYVAFNDDGSFAGTDIDSIQFTANNGSKPNQQINLNIGTANKFDGLTSFDSKSATSGISQDGYTGGDLVGIRIDQSGTLVGSFSNGRSFGLAQMAMAKFTNNEGLSSSGGNVFTQTANSGDPIIGTAATAGRGFIQSSALEGSNVDLSKSLTNLIIIQRGYEANGKTITTSDQMLQTLLGLKR
jgi:flagellar hook protein FlgE